jgi:hypothetical protein
LGVHGGYSALACVVKALLVVAELVEGEAFVRACQAFQGGGDVRDDPVFFDGDECQE